jgi:hypothetical protein
MGIARMVPLRGRLFELSGKIMLASPGWRSCGMALAAITMLGAILVLIRNGEGRHALFPGPMLLLIATAASLTSQQFNG